MEPRIATDPFLPINMSQNIESYPRHDDSACSPNNGMLLDERNFSNTFPVFDRGQFVATANLETVPFARGVLFSYSMA